MDLVLVLALALHTIAFVIAWGYYGIMGRIVLPGVAEETDFAAQAQIVAAIERRALPLVLTSIVLFLITGTYLLFGSSEYEGFGNLFATTWTTLILIKHVVIVVLIGLGVLFDFLVRELPYADDEAAGRRTFRRLRLSAEAATLTGAVVILLTAAAQVSA